MARQKRTTPFRERYNKKVDEAEKARLFALARAYKEHIVHKLEAFLPQRLAQIDRASLQGLTGEEVMKQMYLQGVNEALEAFDVEELMRALEDGDGALKA